MEGDNERGLGCAPESWEGWPEGVGVHRCGFRDVLEGGLNWKLCAIDGN